MVSRRRLHPPGHVLHPSATTTYWKVVQRLPVCSLANRPSAPGLPLDATHLITCLDANEVEEFPERHPESALRHSFRPTRGTLFPNIDKS